ncbi:MAG: DUF72 domain-containing protein [Ignavibacteriae bacterium]|nr:DUF72 domain-containing protein [Ignavibacteriota bacterium]
MAKRKSDEQTLSLFGDAAEQIEHAASTSEYIEKNRPRIRRWASQGIYFGGSSWKYIGWKGQIYNKKYSSKKLFEQNALAEYSDIFPTVCADFALYDFPDPDKMNIIHDQTTDDFKIALKVTDRITIKRYPNLPRFGPKAGTENPDFLNTELFQDAFLKPLEALKHKRGVIIFEFSTFHRNSGISYDAFVQLLDDFLSKLPKGIDYAVELRNSDFLTEEYLKMLQSHGVAHLLNNWTRMPPIIQQLQIAGVFTTKFSVARALLKTGRRYEDAVRLFQPYNEIKEENPELRMGVAEAVRHCIADGRALYAYINNRAEGNSPKTIEGILDMLDRYPVEKL